MRIIEASHSETQFGGYPTFGRADIASGVCDATEIAHLNVLLARGALTIYQIPQAPYTDKLRAVVLDARGRATFPDYLAVLEASGRERTMLTCMADICEEAQFFGVADIGTARPHAHWQYVEMPGANPRGVALTEDGFAALWTMVEAYWLNTVEVERHWKAAYAYAQEAWQNEVAR